MTATIHIPSGNALTTSGERRFVTKRKGINTPSRDISLDIASDALERINSPVSLSVFLLIKHREFEQLVNKSVNPLDYTHHQSFADDYLACNLLRKASHLPTGINLKEAAISNFRKVEESVGIMNRKLIRNRWYPQGDIQLSDFISKVRAICHAVLGRSPQVGKLPELMMFGSGASSSVKRDRGTAYYKSAGKLDSSPLLQPHAHIIVNAIHPWASAFLNTDAPASVIDSSISVVRGARLAYVPKDAKTDRVIAVEPHVNVVLQKGIDKLLQSKLKRIGVDIHDQRKNQKIAEIGYHRGYSTIDLSNASDCISLELIREVLPPDWFQLLDIARSHCVKIEGHWKQLEKFSTAGCGFTFPLETLVFWAICKAATGRPPLAVYGDDIIVYDSDYETVVEGLVRCGFTVNDRKSFTAGHPFRESCGEDFFLGVGVRPFFIRGPIRTLAQRISLHNQIFRYSLRRTYGLNDFLLFHPILHGLRNKSKLLVPYNIGDAGFSSSLADAKKAGNARSIGKLWHSGYMISGLLQRPYRSEMRRYYSAIFHSFTTIADPFSDSASQGLVPHGTKVSWSIASIPVMGWFATDTFEILNVPDLVY